MAGAAHSTPLMNKKEVDMKLRDLKVLMLFGCVAQLMAGCGGGANINIRNPVKVVREVKETATNLADVIGRAFEGALPLESIGLVAPVREVRAEDGSFVLTQTTAPAAPYYSNNKGPIQTRYLRGDGWRKDYAHTKPVRVVVEGQKEPLYGRLAIFPAANVKEEYRLTERFHSRIIVTPQALVQMEKEGVGLSCTVYQLGWQDWCDWALWISRTPIPE